MAKDWEAVVDSHQSDYKKQEIWPLDPSHYRSKIKAVQDTYMIVLFDQGDNTLSKEVWVG